MFKMKKISLVALGAATLFMAPAVVHADETGEKTASVTLGEQPGSIQLVSAPDIEFGETENFPIAEQVTVYSKGTGAPLTVANSRNLAQWNVKVSATPFEGNGSQLSGAELDFMTAGVDHDRQNMGNEVKFHYGTLIPSDGDNHLIMSSNAGGDKSAATGTNSLNFGEGAIKLTTPGGYPGGTYTAQVNWDLEPGEGV